LAATYPSVGVKKKRLRRARENDTIVLIIWPSRGTLVRIPRGRAIYFVFDIDRLAATYGTYIEIERPYGANTYARFSFRASINGVNVWSYVYVRRVSNGRERPYYAKVLRGQRRTNETIRVVLHEFHLPVRETVGFTIYVQQASPK